MCVYDVYVCVYMHVYIQCGRMHIHCKYEAKMHPFFLRCHVGEHQITLLVVWARVVQIMHSTKPMYTPAVCFVCVCRGGGADS